MKRQRPARSAGKVLESLKVSGGILEGEPKGPVAQHRIAITGALNETLCPFSGAKEDLLQPDLFQPPITPAYHRVRKAEPSSPIPPYTG
jgi:hypothetical protein